MNSNYVPVTMKIPGRFKWLVTSEGGMCAGINITFLAYKQLYRHNNELQSN